MERAMGRKRSTANYLMILSRAALFIGLVTLIINGLFVIQLGDSFETLQFRFLFGGMMVFVWIVMNLTARSLLKASKNKGRGLSKHII